jgi:hypothetical protein
MVVGIKYIYIYIYIYIPNKKNFISGQWNYFGGRDISTNILTTKSLLLSGQITIQVAGHVWISNGLVSSNEILHFKTVIVIFKS